MSAIVSENPGRTPPADLPHIPGYEIREILGKGGQGTVYRARQKSLNRVVAIKVLSPKNADSTSLKRRFLAEARLQAKLLRAIQEREIDRVGGNRPIKVDIRIIATSNRHLQAEVKTGTFRE